MRASYIVLLAWAALGGAALAEDANNTAKPTPAAAVPPIHFDLAQPKPARRESLPAAATLGDLTYANEKPPAAAGPAPAVAPKAAVKSAPQVQKRVVAKPAPKPVAAKPAGKPVVAKPANAPWMSEWRRAYIARYGHQPPLPAPRH